MKEQIRSLREGVVGGDQERVLTVALSAVERGADLQRLVTDGLVAAMEEVGRRWNRGDMFLPDVVYSAQIFKEAMKILEPAILAKGKKVGSLENFVIGTVSGDLHDLGKNLVAIMLQMAGFRVIDLGKDVSAESFVSTLKDLGSGLLGMSALLTTTMIEQKRVIDALVEEGIRHRVRVMVGGRTGEYSMG